MNSHLESLETANGGLWENVAVERAQGQAYVSLCVAQLDALLFEVARETLQIVRRRLLLVAHAAHRL